MKRILHLSIVVPLLAAGVAVQGATDIVNNLSEGYVSSEIFDSMEPSKKGGQAFVVDSNNYTLNSISVAVYGGVASVAGISLWSDNSGFPGSLIEDLGMVNIPLNESTQVATSTSHPTLSANVQYWVVVEYISGNFEVDYAAGVTASGPGALGPDRTASTGANWGGDSTESFKIAVNGTLVVAETEVALDGSNNLVISDISSGGKDDSLQIFSDTTNSRFVIQSGSALDAQVGALFNAVTAHVPFSSVTGGQIIIQGAGGNDSLTIDFSLGDFAKSILYQGGSGGNDTLDLVGGGPFSSVTHTFQNASDGMVGVGGNASISYSGLEPIYDSLAAATRTFVFGASADVVTLAPSGGPGMILSSASTSESVLFTNPTTELSIQTGAGNDSVTISGLAPGFSANLTINGESGDDSINLNTASLSVADLAVTAETIEVSMSPVTSTGAQHYDGALVLQTHATFNAGGNMTFSGTVDGISHQGESLTLNCSGMTTFTQPVGATMALGNFSTDAPGSLVLPASVTAGIMFVRDPASLSSAPTTTLTGSTGVVFLNTLDGNVAGAQNLVINSTQTGFEGSVGGVTPLGSITTDAAGTTTVNASEINASLTFNDAVELGDDTALTGTSIVFNSSIDSAAGENNNLEVSGTSLAFHGLVGAVQPLQDLVAGAADSILLNGTQISVTRFLTFDGWVVLDADTTLTSSQDVTFNGEVDTAIAEFNDLTVSAGGTTTFALPVGEAHPLGALSVGASGQTHFVAGQVWAQGAIVISNPVTISSGGFGDTLVFNGDISVTFASTIDGSSSGGQSLAVNSPTTTFNGSIGSVVPLRNITTDAGMQTFFNGSSVTTAGGGLQEYNDDVEVGMDGFVFTGDDIRFAGLLDSFSGGGSRSIVINAAGKTEFLMNVGSVRALSSLTTDASGSTVIGGDVIADFSQTYNDAVVLEADVVLSSEFGDNIVFNSTVDSAAGENNSLTVNTYVTTEFNGAVGGMEALSVLTTDGPGTTRINASILVTTGAQTFGDLVVLGANVVLSGSSVSFASPLESDPGGNFDLAVNAATTSFMGAVGAGQPLGNLTTDPVGVTVFGPMANGVTVANNVTFNDAVLLENSWPITAGNVSFNSTVDAAVSGNAGLIVSTTAGGVITFGDGVGDDAVGAVGELMDLACHPDSQIVINAASVSSAGNQEYFGALALATSGSGNPVTTLNGRDIIFHGTVNAASAGVHSLVVNSSSGGMTLFGDAVGDDEVGAIGALNSLTTNADGQTLINSASVTTTGQQTYGDAVILGTSGAGNTATLFAGDFVYFATTLDSSLGAESITIALSAMGQVYFGGSVGGLNPLAEISVGPGGATLLSANQMNDPTTVTTSGPQLYQNPVKLLVHATLSSLNNGNISLSGGVEGHQASGQNLTINTGGVTHFGDIGAQVPLGVLTTDASGSTTIDTAFVGLGGPTVFLDPVTLLQEVNIQQLGAGDVVFQSTLDSDATARGASYFAPPGSSFLFVGAVGGTAPLDYLAGSGELTIASPLVKTVGGQFFGGAVYFDETCELATMDSSVSFGDVHVIENAHVVVNTGNGAGDIMLGGNAFGDAGGVLETMTLRAGAGEASVRGVVAPSIRIIIETAPVIVRQPVGLTVAAGNSFTLSVSAIGSNPLQYQWRRNGVPIPAAVGAMLTVPSASVAESGIFTVVVSNDAGSVTSSGASVNVLTPPSIDTQPQGQAVAFGANVMFSVSASGSPTLQYQWRFNGQNIPGATSSSLSVNNVQAGNLGRYTVIVQNGVGAVTSDPADLSVALPALAVALSPDQALAQTEAGASKSVVIPDGSGYFMRWQAPGTGIAKFDTKGSGYDTRITVYSGGTLGGLQRIASDDDSGGFLTSEVTFNVVSGMVYSILVEGVEGGFGVLVVNWSFEATAVEAPIISVQPESLSAGFGGSATLSVTATGSAPLVYQWRHNGVDIVGANQATLTVAGIAAEDLGQYLVVVSNEGGSVRSRPAHIDVGSDPAVISRSKFENPAAGPTPQFGGGRHNLVVTAGALGSQVFNNARSVTEPGEPNHGNAIGGSSRWFEVTASTDGTMLVDTVGSEIDTTMAVYTGSSLATLALVAQDNDGAPDGVSSQVSFAASKDVTYIIAVDGVGGATGVIELNWLLGDPPSITVGPVDMQANRLETVTLSVTATGTPAPTFAWQLDGVTIEGAAESSLTLVNVEPADAGIYTLVASNPLGSASSSALLIVDNPLRFLGDSGLQPDGSFKVTLIGPENASAGISVALEASADFKSWTQVATATSMNGMFQLMDADAKDHGNRYYRVRLNTGN